MLLINKQMDLSSFIVFFHRGGLDKLRDSIHKYYDISCSVSFFVVVSLSLAHHSSPYHPLRFFIITPHLSSAKQIGKCEWPSSNTSEMKWWQLYMTQSVTFKLVSYSINVVLYNLLPLSICNEKLCRWYYNIRHGHKSLTQKAIDYEKLMPICCVWNYLAEYKTIMTIFTAQKYKILGECNVRWSAIVVN